MRHQNRIHLLMLLVSLISISTFAHDLALENAEGQMIYYIFINDNTELSVCHPGSSYGSGYYGSVSIPESVTYNGRVYKVTSISNLAFKNCSELTDISIPNSITHIGKEALHGTAWFNNQPDGLVYIGRYAYRYKGVMPNNTELTIKDGTIGFADMAFSEEASLTSIVIPNTVISISEKAFYKSEKLHSVILPSNLQSIGTMAFDGCKGLISISIPSSLKNIGFRAFRNCSSLAKVVIPDIETWCNISFNGEYSNPLCYARHLYDNRNDIITNVIIPNTITSINDNAFEGYLDLISITIPNSVTSIGDHAFSGCSGLTSITIPNSVTEIGGYAFSGCSGLMDVYCISETIPETSNYAFGYQGEYISNAILHVPAGSISAYSNTEPWSYFKEIVAISSEDATGIKSLEGASAEPFDVYDMNGHKVLTHVTSLDGLSNGVYIINGKKMIIK